MKIKIEEYKGQIINYDDDNDKFVCEISIEDHFKSTKRQSLNDVRKEIDAFIKLNVDFKPFKVFMVSGYNNRDFEVYNISGIRTDGKFIVYQDGWENNKSHYGKKEMMRARLYDPEIVAAKEKFSNELDKEE